MLARAFATEAGIPFFAFTGSEFIEDFECLGAWRVRKLFNAARKRSPSIIFIDDIDSIGVHRIAMLSRRTRAALNQLLVELDGFKQNNKLIVIAATNLHSAVLDSALVRSGRFDRYIVIPLPDYKARREILDIYMSKVKTLLQSQLHRC